MKLRKQFSNLKKGAKKVFIGMLVLCLVSTATGIGSIFAYADECENHYADSYSCYDEHTHIGTCVNCGKEIEAEHSFNSEGECVVCGYNPGPTNDNDDDTDDGEDGSEDDGSGDEGSSYGEWQKNDATTHIRYNDAGESETQEHQFTDWVSNGNGVMARVCTVCGYMEEQEDTTGGDTHTHTYTYTDNGDGTHTAVCSECEDTKTEAHNLGLWTSDGRGNHTRTCALCDYSEVEPCSYDENGICTVCKFNEANLAIASSKMAKKSMKFSARNLNLTAAIPGLVTSGEGPVGYLAFYSDAPAPATSLVYNGKAQDLFTSVGTRKTLEEMADTGVTYASSSGISITSGTGTTVTDAGEYTATETITYQINNDTSNNYTAIGTFKITLEKASFANDVTVIPESSSYVETPVQGQPYVKLKIGDTYLTYGTDFVLGSSSGSFDTYPVVGATATIVLKANNNNFDDSLITKTLLVEDVYPTFNGSTALKDVYHDEVTVLPPAGYSIAPELGSVPGTFADKIVYKTTSPQTDPTLYFKSSETNKTIKKDFPVVIDNSKYTIDELLIANPQFYPTRDYTGSEVALMQSAPTLNDEFIAKKNLSVSWGFMDESDNVVSTKSSPTATEIGPHNYYFFLHYVTEEGVERDAKITTPFKTVIVKDMGHSDITYTAPDNTPDYQSLDSSKDIKDFYNVKDTNAADPQLQNNVDYTVSVSSEANYYETGTDITLTYTGITNEADNAYYKGTTTKTVPVSSVNVLLNGAAQVSSYDDAVLFTAAGYTISDSPDGTFNTEFKFSDPCTDYTLPLYFKKDGTSRIVKQTITGLNIGPAAAVKVLYDGEEELKPFYYDTVRISADGYWVKNVNSGTFSDEVYELNYDTLVNAHKETNPVKDFKLYFKNKSTGLVSTKVISGVNLFKLPDIEVLYNGTTLKDWYNDNVLLTASGYTISDKVDSGFVAIYTIKGTGTVYKDLYFKDKNTGTVVDADTTTPGIQPYRFVVAIDKTAPTGVINLSSYSSDTFTTQDVVKAYTNGSQKATISASDALSGVDYIHFYVSDTFYASPSDVKAAITEKSGAWRTYSSSSQPALVKDKNNYIYAKIVDKAGNETIISLGNILYDTVAPKMTTAKVTPSTTDTSKTLIGLAGTDKLSGINRFKYVFKEKEEGKKYDTPGKDWMFDNGEYVKTTDEKDGTAVASATIDALDSEKTYLFYFIAVDRAGNISDVMTQEVKGEAASSNKNSGTAASGGSSSGANGLTPAPNGIAGGGSGSGKQGGGSGSSSSGSSKSSKDKKSQSALGDKDREINRNPYIAEATGNVKIGINETSGWNKIASEVNKADKGAVVEVEMAGLSNVSNELFTSMNNRDVQVKLRMAEDVEWEIKGEEVPDARSDIDMGVRLGSRNIPEQIITDVAGTNPHVEFSINHNGDFGFVATIAVPVGESNKGMYTTLYHYDETKKELEVAGDGRVDDRGYAKFPLTHASDYTVVITPERILSAADTDAQTSTLVGAEAESQSSQYLDGARLRLTDLFRIRGSMRIWLFFIALLSATICMVILYLPALQSRNQNDQGDLF